MRSIGPYTIQRELGRGGMGAVYLAEDSRLGRPVAVKVLLPELSTGQERLVREGQVVAKLNHPGIVRVHDLGLDEGRLVLVMEYVEGESLDRRLKRSGPLDPREAAGIARKVALALEYAHQQGVLHRDLKPANVLVSTEGRVALTDFGLAKDLSAARERLTKTGEMVGTPAFMPPEQLEGTHGAIGPRSDVYGLGATLFALLTGRPPFQAPTAVNLAFAVLSREPSAPSALTPGVPEPLDRVVLQCLAKAQDARYPSAAALAADLDRFLAGEDVLAARPRRAGGRRLVSRISLAAAAVAVLALGAALTSDPRAGEERPKPPPVASPAPGPEPVASEAPPVQERRPWEPPTDFSLDDLPRSANPFVDQLFTQADQGDASAFQALGGLFEEGKSGLPRDRQAAMALYHESVSRRSIAARVSLARLIIRDFAGQPGAGAAAEGYLEEAAARGDVKALVVLGNHLERGAAPRALRLYQKASAAGSWEGTAEVGRCLLEGIGGPPDADEGVRLLKSALAAGHWRAGFYLGRALVRGTHLPKDEAQGRRILLQAAQGGDRVAKALLEQLDAEPSGD